MKTPIIILHGWGKSGSDYRAIQNIFEKNGYSVFAPDFPGFGNEKLTKPVMTMDDYVEFLFHYLKKNKLKKVILVCHSFGGRVAAKFVVLHPEMVEKMILSGSPLIRMKLSFKKRIIQKIIRKSQLVIHFVPEVLQKPVRWAIYRFIGEFDYYKAQKLRETFKNVINENASNYVHKIKTKTLILWGENDTLALVEHGKKIAQTILGARLVVLKNEGHKVPYDNPKLFAEEVLKFIK